MEKEREAEKREKMVEAEDGKVGAESRLRKPDGILQASLGSPPST